MLGQDILGKWLRGKYMNLHHRVIKTKKNLKAYLRHNADEFFQPMWSADGYSLVFKMKTDSG